jgi:hypothetical protein
MNGPSLEQLVSQDSQLHIHIHGCCDNYFGLYSLFVSYSESPCATLCRLCCRIGNIRARFSFVREPCRDSTRCIESYVAERPCPILPSLFRIQSLALPQLHPAIQTPRFCQSARVQDRLMRRALGRESRPPRAAYCSHRKSVPLSDAHSPD